MSIFSIGLSGLNAARNAFNTTSNNISNVNTPGYNRELTQLANRDNQQGVEVQGIQRQFDPYVANQLNSANSHTSALTAYQTQVSQIDDLLADQDAGLAPLMQKFFSSVSQLASSPSDPAAREGVIGTANTLSAQFRSFDSYLADMGSGLDGQLKDQVKQINNLSTQIAGLNQQISLAKAKVGHAPNGLLDQRDHLVAEISQHVDVRAMQQSDGSYNISIGNGQPLVSGKQHFNLEVIQSADDPTQMTIAYNDAAGNQVPVDDSSLSGGTLGGLLQFRDQSLNPTRNQLGQLAVAFAEGINQVHEQGVDINGDAGGAMFTVGPPEAYASAKNTGTASMAVAFDPAQIASLTASDYTLRYNVGTQDFVITRNDTGESQTQSLDASNQLHFGGVTITVNNPADLANGDSYQVEPTRTAAGGIQNIIQNTDKIAAAGPSGGSGNNENALALEKVQQQSIVEGSASFSQTYAKLVGDVGSQTQIVNVNLKAQQNLSDELTAVQQSDSGVNLDEEAVNLIKYQQYYQANAKVIQTGATILDSILNLH